MRRPTSGCCLVEPIRVGRSEAHSWVHPLSLGSLLPVFPGGPRVPAFSNLTGYSFPLAPTECSRWKMYSVDKLHVKRNSGMKAWGRGSDNSSTKSVPGMEMAVRRADWQSVGLTDLNDSIPSIPETGRWLTPVIPVLRRWRWEGQSSGSSLAT